MEKKENNIFFEDLPKDSVDNLPVQAFSTEQLVLCPKCKRSNAPTKIKCIYCGEIINKVGTNLSSSEISSHRKPEFWGNGYNLIFLPKGRPVDRDKISFLSGLINLSGEVLENLLKLEQSLPLIRTESEKELEKIRQIFEKSGIESRIMSDLQFEIKKPPRRLRGIEFQENNLKLFLFNNLETIEIFRDDLILVVSGSIFEQVAEAVQKKGKSAESKILESSQTASDNPLIDIYSQSDLFGYRISTIGFDFSCLGKDKGFIAVENIKQLLNRFKDFAPKAGFIEEYQQVRSILDNIWEIEQNRVTTGLKHTGIGKFNLGHKIIQTNLEQFTKYSRMQRHLL